MCSLAIFSQSSSSFIFGKNTSRIFTLAFLEIIDFSSRFHFPWNVGKPHQALQARQYWKPDTLLFLNYAAKGHKFQSYKLIYSLVMFDPAIPFLLHYILYCYC